MPTSEFYKTVSSKIAAIEQELKLIGAWTNAPLNPALLENLEPFGGNALPFENWLQFVLIPTVKNIIATAQDFPASSQVGTYASSIFDARPECQNLTKLLIEFDELFN